MSKAKFLNLIKDQRKEKKTEKFSGTFLDYLELISENPGLVKLSHKRLYDALVSHGVETLRDDNPRKHRLFEGDDVKVYNYFKDEFFGNERVISKIMSFLRSASLKGEESRQVLLLMGPV